MIVNKLYKTAAILLLFCMGSVAGAQQKETIVFSPQWTPQAQFAGYYVALEKGFYSEAGLDVRIDHPSASNSCINRLKSGDSQLISLQLMSALRFAAQDLPLVNVLQTSQQNTLMIISRTPIPNIYRLKDMRVGCWKSGFSELPMILDRIYKLNIQWVPFRSNINLFISGAIDATMAMSYNEKIQLEMSGQRLNEDQLLYFSKLGYNIPEDGLYTTNSYLNTHREQVRRFVEASKRGWLWCVDHPQEALDIVMKVVRANNVATSRVAQQKMLKEILRAQLVKDTDQRTFRLDPNDFQFTNHFMLENGYIPKSIDYKTFVAE